MTRRRCRQLGSDDESCIEWTDSTGSSTDTDSSGGSSPCGAGFDSGGSSLEWLVDGADNWAAAALRRAALMCFAPTEVAEAHHALPASTVVADRHRALLVSTVSTAGRQQQLGGV